MLITFLEWFGSAMGVGGALLLAFNNQYSRYGWVVFLCANTVMLIFTFSLSFYGLFLREIVFTGVSLLGMYNTGMLPILSRMKKT